MRSIFILFIAIITTSCIQSYPSQWTRTVDFLSVDRNNNEYTLEFGGKTGSVVRVSNKFKYSGSEKKSSLTFDKFSHVTSPSQVIVLNRFGVFQRKLFFNELPSQIPVTKRSVGVNDVYHTYVEKNIYTNKDIIVRKITHSDVTEAGWANMLVEYQEELPTDYPLVSWKGNISSGMQDFLTLFDERADEAVKILPK